MKSKDKEMKMTDLLNCWFEALDCHSRTFLGSVAVLKKGMLAPVAVKEERKANKCRTVVVKRDKTRE